MQEFQINHLENGKFFLKFAKNIFQKFDICLSSNLKSKKYLKFLV